LNNSEFDDKNCLVVKEIKKKHFLINFAGAGLLAVPILELVRSKLMLGSGSECISAELAASFLGLVILLKNNSSTNK